jgi:hypothetical protein
MSELFTPYKIGPIELRNRTIRSAAFEAMCPGQRPSKELFDYHTAVARGGIGIQPIEADWNVASVWEVKLPEGVGDDWILEADYLGDVARVYVDGVPYADDFFKGLPLKCALWRIPKGKVEIKILPWSNSRNIYIQAPMRPKENGAKLNSVRLVPRDLMK